jgi:hypothetical protein
VLLSAVSPSGHELPSPAALQQLAQQLGVMGVPSLQGTLPELTARLSEGCELAKSSCSKTSEQPDSKKASCNAVNIAMRQNELRHARSNWGSSRQQPAARQAAACEGYVVQDQSSGQRYKLVQNAFLKTGHAASKLLHPLVVWDAVYCGKSRAELAQNLPAHYQAELDAILSALEHQFWSVQQQLDLDLQQSWLDPAASSSRLADQQAGGAGPDAKTNSGVSTTTTSSGCGSVMTSGASTDISAVCSAAKLAAPAGPCEDEGTADSSSTAVPASDDISNSSKLPAHCSKAAVSTISADCAVAPTAAGGAERASADRRMEGNSSSSTGCKAASCDAGSSSLPAVSVLCPPGRAAQAYAEALEYAQHKSSAYVHSMFLQSDSDSGTRSYSSSAGSQHGPAPSLRGLLLSCIKPSTDGCLQGYTPSAAFLQTYCKGWAQGPRHGRVSVLDPEPLISKMLTDQALTAVLGQLEGRDVGSALRVCRGWSKLLLGDAGSRAKAEQYRSSAAARHGQLYAQLLYDDYELHSDYDYVERWASPGYYGCCSDDSYDSR